MIYTGRFYERNQALTTQKYYV